MSQIVTPSQLVSNLEQDLAADWRHYHLTAHVSQFGGLFVGGFAASVAADGWHVAGWGALAGLALAAAGAAVRQMWPQVPWSAVKSALEEAKGVADRGAPVAPVAPAAPAGAAPDAALPAAPAAPEAPSKQPSA